MLLLVSVGAASKRLQPARDDCRYAKMRASDIPRHKLQSVGDEDNGADS